MARILLTGTTGYIGRRILDNLLSSGHELICSVRDKRRFDIADFTGEQLSRISVVESDFSDAKSLVALPEDIDAAYYLIHSMSTSGSDFSSLEEETARNFVQYINKTQARQVIYLSGIINDSDLSKHLRSRYNVETILAGSTVPLTTLRAGIIIGSGSASFEIIRDLVEKLPVMIAPRWLKTRCQPIAIKNVTEYLEKVLFNEVCYGGSFDIAGPDIVTYKEMLMGYASVRGLARKIIVVPVLTPRLSSLWLYFVTSTSFSLARNLVTSMKNEVIAADNRIDSIISLPEKFTYKDSLRRTLLQIEHAGAVSSWKDSVRNDFNLQFMGQSEAPRHGVYQDVQEVEISGDPKISLDRIWRIGGHTGWYIGKWLWEIRGFMDKMVGGVGLRRGRRHHEDLKVGDAVDFWRVLYVDREERRLLLFAEMKLPGEAWLEFRIREEDNKTCLYQTATFRPKGLLGRAYWWLVSPFHLLIFRGMAKRIANG